MKWGGKTVRVEEITGPGESPREKRQERSCDDDTTMSGREGTFSVLSSQCSRTGTTHTQDNYSSVKIMQQSKLVV